MGRSGYQKQGCKFSDFFLISEFKKKDKSVKDHVIILENRQKMSDFTLKYAL